MKSSAIKQKNMDQTAGKLFPTILYYIQLFYMLVATNIYSVFGCQTYIHNVRGVVNKNCYILFQFFSSN